MLRSFENLKVAKMFKHSAHHTHTQKRIGLCCLSLELKECVQPDVTICHVSVKGRFFSPLLLFLMGNLDQLRNLLFREQGKKMGFYHCIALLAQRDDCWEIKSAGWRK